MRSMRPAIPLPYNTHDGLLRLATPVAVVIGSVVVAAVVVVVSAMSFEIHSGFEHGKAWHETYTCHRRR
jgi:hypothetical protein